MALQASLLDLIGSPGPRPLGPEVQRCQLGDGAWIDLRRGWMAGADALFERLTHTVPWRAERRPMYGQIVDVPRLTAFYAEGDRLPEPVLEEARRSLSERYANESGGPLSTVGLCLYRHGRDSVAWHGDTIGRGATEDTVVAIVSLAGPGACRSGAAGVGPPGGSSWHRGTCWSWGGAASAPGSTRSPRRRAPWERASACSSANVASAEREARPGGASG